MPFSLRSSLFLYLIQARYDLDLPLRQITCHFIGQFLLLAGLRQMAANGFALHPDFRQEVVAAVVIENQFTFFLGT